MPKIRLTARFSNGRHITVVNSTKIGLANAQFESLAILVRKRLQTETGYTRLREFGPDDANTYQRISRLRKAFDLALGAGGGNMLVRRVARGTYVLVPERSEIRIDPNIVELAPEHLPWSVVNDLVAPVDLCQNLVRDHISVSA